MSTCYRKYKIISSNNFKKISISKKNEKSNFFIFESNKKQNYYLMRLYGLNIKKKYNDNNVV